MATKGDTARATKGATARVSGADYDFDLDPVTFITVGTIGPPGQRTFYLQAAQRKRVVSLIIEKEHAAALVMSIQRLLDAMGPEHGGTGEAGQAGKAAAPADVAPDAEADQPADDQESGSADARGAMDLLEPVEASFRVGQLGIGVDEERDMIVLVAEEITDDEAAEPGRKARFAANPGQMAALSRRAMAVVSAGRPVCELCGEPMEPEGHFCPRRNGHPAPLT